MLAFPSAMCAQMFKHQNARGKISKFWVRFDLIHNAFAWVRCDQRLSLAARIDQRWLAASIGETDIGSRPD